MTNDEGDSLTSSLSSSGGEGRGEEANTLTSSVYKMASKLHMTRPGISDFVILSSFVIRHSYFSGHSSFGFPRSFAVFFLQFGHTNGSIKSRPNRRSLHAVA